MTEINQPKTKCEKYAVDPLLTRSGGLSYLEIPAIDTRRSAQFYEKVFGWHIEDADTDNPKFSDPTGHLLGRWLKSRKAIREAGLLPYIYVECLDDAVNAVIANGGEILEAPYPEGNLRVSTIRDPAGNVIGLWQEAV